MKQSFERSVSRPRNIPSTEHHKTENPDKIPKTSLTNLVYVTKRCAQRETINERSLSPDNDHGVLSSLLYKVDSSRDLSRTVRPNSSTNKFASGTTKETPQPPRKVEINLQNNSTTTTAKGQLQQTINNLTASGTFAPRMTTDVARPCVSSERLMSKSIANMNPNIIHTLNSPAPRYPSRPGKVKIPPKAKGARRTFQTVYSLAYEPDPAIQRERDKKQSLFNGKIDILTKFSSQLLGLLDDVTCQAETSTGNLTKFVGHFNSTRHEIEITQLDVLASFNRKDEHEAGKFSNLFRSQQDELKTIYHGLDTVLHEVKTLFSTLKTKISSYTEANISSDAFLRDKLLEFRFVEEKNRETLFKTKKQIRDLQECLDTLLEAGNNPEGASTQGGQLKSLIEQNLRLQGEIQTETENKALVDQKNFALRIEVEQLKTNLADLKDRIKKSREGHATISTSFNFCSQSNRTFGSPSLQDITNGGGHFEPLHVELLEDEVMKLKMNLAKTLSAKTKLEEEITVLKKLNEEATSQLTSLINVSHQLQRTVESKTVECQQEKAATSHQLEKQKSELLACLSMDKATLELKLVQCQESLEAASRTIETLENQLISMNKQDDKTNLFSDCGFSQYVAPLNDCQGHEELWTCLMLQAAVIEEEIINPGSNETLLSH